MAKTHILDEYGEPFEVMTRGEASRLRAGQPQRLRASYDIAQTNHDNANQWAGADWLDADASDSPGVRQTARNRSRHETQNNPTLTGVVRTITHYEIGTGPTLHLDHDDEEFGAEVEEKWREWADTINLPGKLRQMVYGRVVDGESFARIGLNPGLKNEVQLDIQPFECDRCYTLWLPYLTPYRIDGIWFDTWGNPTYYDILQYHPGGVFPMPTWKFDTTPAQYILHLFNPERANQHRGIPEMMSSTDLFADRRRFRKATIGAAESAANVGGFLTTDQPADDGYAPAENSITAFPRNSLVVAPNQYDLKQIDPKHPAQTYEMFAAETLNEATRPMSLGLNVAKCDSSRYNFAGGRLDIITSWKAVEVNQSNNTWRVVNPLFRAWYVEARIIYGWQSKDEGKIPAHQFFWVGMPYSDPEAEQTADEQAIQTGLKGIQDIYARRGKDWKVQRRMNARALNMDEDEYTEWIIGNLGKPKGGDGNPQQQAPGEDPAVEPDEPQAEEPNSPETPEEVAAKFHRLYPGLASRMNGHTPKALRASGPLFLSVPDIRQETEYSCGSASAMAVGRFFNVGPLTLGEWSEQLGTTPERGTQPQPIVTYLSQLGLQVTACRNLSIDDLAAATASGRPVIVCCQDYVSQSSAPRNEAAEWEYGHWMVCLGVVGEAPNRFLVFQDPSEENMERLPGGSVKPADEDPEYVVEEPGRRFVSEQRWLPAWHDQADEGEIYDHYGIIVGMAETATPQEALESNGEAL